MNELTHLSLFTGIGGIDLAAEWAGFKTIGQVEKDAYAREILEKHWPGVHKWKDILWFYATDFRGKTGCQRPTLITGGFPCQPFSCAGNQEGTGDDRYLWPEMFRIVQELRPSWVLGENVAGIFNLALDDVLADLEDTEYTARAFSIPACAVGAPHERQRIFIVAHTEGGGTGGIPARSRRSVQAAPHPDWHGKDVPNPNGPGASPGGQDRGMGGVRESPTGSNTLCKGLQVSRTAGVGCQERSGGTFPPTEQGRWWDVEPGMGRVADRVPDRVDRLRGLGNAVVPQQVYPILKAIAEIERGGVG